jgi:hypothetical protein
MRLSKLYVFTRLFSNATPSLMPTKKLCKDCRHFIGDKIECRKFSDTDFITGKVTYYSARRIREDVTKCGEKAIHFEENNFKIITIPYYFFKDNSLLILPGALLTLYMIGIIKYMIGG